MRSRPGRLALLDWCWSLSLVVACSTGASRSILACRQAYMRERAACGTSPRAGSGEDALAGTDNSWRRAARSPVLATPAQPRRRLHRDGAAGARVRACSRRRCSPLTSRSSGLYEAYLAQGSDLGRTSFSPSCRSATRCSSTGARRPPERDAAIVYTPTIGEAIAHFSHEYRRPRACFLSFDHPEDMNGRSKPPASTPTGRRRRGDRRRGDPRDRRLGRRWGQISGRKLTVYPASAGSTPGGCLAVMLDVGTNRRELLEDPLYHREPARAVDDRTYDEVRRRLRGGRAAPVPNALLHWRISGRQMRAGCSSATARPSSRSTTTCRNRRGGPRRRPLRPEGAGAPRRRALLHLRRRTAGRASPDQLCDAMVAAGLDEPRRNRRFWCVDAEGLLLETTLGLPRLPARTPCRRSRRRLRRDELAGSAPRSRQPVQPTTLIGRPPRRCVLRGRRPGDGSPLRTARHPAPSNPTPLAEASGGSACLDRGRALIATGSPFPPPLRPDDPCHRAGETTPSSSPGLGLGRHRRRGDRVTAPMLRAAAVPSASRSIRPPPAPRSSPKVEALRETSVAVAVAVAEAAAGGGVTRWPLPADLEAQVRAFMWQPSYRPIRASERWRIGRVRRVGGGGVLPCHPIGVEERAVQGDGVPADVVEAGRVGEEDSRHLLQLGVELLGVVGVRATVTHGPPGDPLDTALQPHPRARSDWVRRSRRPSSRSCRTPRGAFGVLSHRSVPAHSRRPAEVVVSL